jgi:hypothetical protein
MADYLDIVEHNPITFVKNVCDAIADGYTVTNDIAGYPSFTPYCQVRLFKGAEDEAFITPSWEDDLTVENYDGLKFMLTLSLAVKAGWRFVEGGQHFFDERGLKSVQLSRKPVAKLEAKPKTTTKQNKQQPKKALVAEPTITEMENIDDKQAE